MTIASQKNKAGPFLGNGVTTTFGAEFRINDATHAKVILTDAVGVQHELALNSDYAVSGVGSDDGFDVAFDVAPATGESIVILLDVPFLQQTDLENQGAYNAEDVEAALDLGTQRDLQLKELVDRSVKLPPSASTEDLDALVGYIVRLGRVSAEIATVAGIKDAVEAVADIADEVVELIEVGQQVADDKLTVEGYKDAAAASAAAAAASAGAVTPVQDQIGAATDEAPANTAMMAFRKADGSLIKRSVELFRTLIATMADNLVISKANPQISLNKAASGQQAAIFGRNGTAGRWSILLGNSSAESGDNAGSNLAISRMDDSGSWIDDVVEIYRKDATVVGSIIATVANYRAKLAGKILTTDVWDSTIPVDLGSTLTGDLTLNYANFIVGYGTATGNVTFKNWSGAKNQSGIIYLTASGGNRTVSFDTSKFVTPDNKALKVIASGTTRAYSYTHNTVRGKTLLIDLGAV